MTSARLFGSYARVLSTPGALGFSSAALVARLPLSMVNIGIVLLVEGSTDSYATAGVVSAVYTLAQAVFALLQGRLADARGQGPVLAVASVVFAVAMASLVALVRADAPTVVVWAAAALGGAALPQVGSCVRARWSYVLDDPGQRQTAFALEAVADEVVFLTGPIIVTVLATTVDPALGIAAAVVAGTLGGLTFAAQRSTEPPAHRSTGPAGPAAPLRWRILLPLAVASAGLGSLFGGAEVTTVAFAEEQGSQAYAAPLLALWALGSLLSGLVTGAITWRRGPAARMRVGTIAMTATMAPLALVDSVTLLGAILLLGGAAIAPTLVGLIAETEHVVPRARLTEGLALVHTGLIAGVAAGAALCGAAVDAGGSAAAWLVCAASGLVAVAAAQALPRHRSVTGGGRPPGGRSSAATPRADAT